MPRIIPTPGIIFMIVASVGFTIYFSWQTYRLYAKTSNTCDSLGSKNVSRSITILLLLLSILILVVSIMMLFSNTIRNQYNSLFLPRRETVLEI